jgi:low temperature requirement protein LtrA
LLRPGSGEGSSRVTYVELFFDLVFVFAVTQTSHILIEHPSGTALAHSVIIVLLVWWVWVDTTWVGNWLDPERGSVRGMFIGLMLLGMLFSVAIPDAFGDRAVLFAVTLVAIQLGRSLFTVFAFARTQPDHALNFVRITTWLAVSSALWLLGAFAPDSARIWIWLLALAIDYTGPRARFWMPRLGRSPLETWDVTGEHMSERVSLFLIIALGESIIVTGETFAGDAIDARTVTAFVAAFAGTVLMWFLYFNHAQRGGSEYISRSDSRGLVAQVSFTYTPAILVAGIVFSAVGDGLVLRNPGGAPDAWTAGLVCGSTALYLLGNALFARSVGRPWPVANLVGAIVVAAAFVAWPVLAPLALAWIANAVMLAVVIADELSYRAATAR